MSAVVAARRRGRNRTQAPGKDGEGGRTGGVAHPPGESGHARGRMRNLGRERVARNAGEKDEKDQIEPDGRR